MKYIYIHTYFLRVISSIALDVVPKKEARDSFLAKKKKNESRGVVVHVDHSRRIYYSANLSAKRADADRKLSRGGV